MRVLLWLKAIFLIPTILKPALGIYYYDGNVLVESKSFCPSLHYDELSSPLWTENKIIILNMQPPLSSYNSRFVCEFPPLNLNDSASRKLNRSVVGLLTSFILPFPQYVGIKWDNLDYEPCSEFIQFRHKYEDDRDPVPLCKATGPFYFNTSKTLRNQIEMKYPGPWSSVTKAGRITAYLVFKVASVSGCEYRIQSYSLFSSCDPNDTSRRRHSFCRSVACSLSVEVLKEFVIKLHPVYLPPVTEVYTKTTTYTTTSRRSSDNNGRSIGALLVVALITGVLRCCSALYKVGGTSAESRDDETASSSHINNNILPLSTTGLEHNTPLPSISINSATELTRLAVQTLTAPRAIPEEFMPESDFNELDLTPVQVLIAAALPAAIAGDITANYATETVSEVPDPADTEIQVQNEDTPPDYESLNLKTMSDMTLPTYTEATRVPFTDK